MAAAVRPLSVEVSASSVGRFGGANAVLDAAVRLWFVTALIGQWAFLYYIAGFYDAATLRGDFALWNRNTHLLKGYVAGDTAGNLAFAFHVLLAAIVTFGGALQLISQSRARWHSVHRWNGRLFLVTAIGGAISGLFMIWVRGSRANFVAGLATSIDAGLIITFAVLAWRAARARLYTVHRRWALRTFIVASGVWFQRVGIFGWTTFEPAAIGMNRNFDGWFDLSWAFGCYLLPLAVLEVYLRVKDRGGPRSRYALAVCILVLAAATAFGSYAAYMFVWRHALFRLGA
ncbi:MAG TPA: DUF2306 domain-containing protein [Rhodanobacteraceae bacterium]|jgi:hypothetical protein|nr:DUF2306 domain-containing protein [Rhodanobacteraceae bacterium]